MLVPDEWKSAQDGSPHQAKEAACTKPWRHERQQQVVLCLSMGSQGWGTENYQGSGGGWSGLTVQMGKVLYAKEACEWGCRGDLETGGGVRVDPSGHHTI